ncbi:MAG: DNA recombination protein RmuC [Caldisericia bacterium]|nr:DNA recombination protein RmuC [Caldisericia bacterium]
MNIELILLISILAILVINLIIYLVKMSALKTDTSKIVDNISLKLPENLFNVLSKMGLNEQIGSLKTLAEKIEKVSGELTQIFKNPQERGYLGETVLENILKDTLPTNLYGIKEKIPSIGNKIPDAYIKLDSEIICIDAKFPLENYRKMCEVKDDNKTRYKNEFRKDVEKHLNKILDDYIKPEQGTAKFAFAFIPAESVYYYLLTEESDMMKNYLKKGVIPASPNMLYSQLTVAKAGFYAKALRDSADKIVSHIDSIKSTVDKLEREWSTFFNTHFQNAYNKAKEIPYYIQELYNKISELINTTKFTDSNIN